MAEGACACGSWPKTDHGGSVCKAPIEKRNILCPPCGVGNHAGRPCEAYKPRSVAAHLDRLCVVCKLDSAVHAQPAGVLV